MTHTMKNLLFALLSITLMAASCEQCYDCSCETYTEVNGQVVDTNETITPVCGKAEDLEPYEDDGCLCSAR